VSAAQIAAAGVVLTAALAGCAGSVEDTADGPELPAASSSVAADPGLGEQEPAPEESAPTPEEPAGPPTSQRGNIIKQIGEEGGFTDGDTVLASFAVDKITPDLKCQASNSYPPENGHMLGVDMRFATTPELAGSSLDYLTVSPYDFQFVGRDGLTTTNLGTMATYSCVDEQDRFTSSRLNPGSQYAGTIALDVPDTSGVLIYKPSLGGGLGWEWQLP
jgi:hypothetical protein